MAESLRLIPGTLVACREVRPGCSEWEARLEDGAAARAVAYPELCGPLRPGDRVLLNATAQALGLGTGGAHFVLCRLDPAPEPGEPFPGREAGHVMRLRYTGLQHRVQSVEEEGSPHRQALEACPGLGGMPVLAAELHSMAATAAVAARAAAPELRIVLVQLDTAALPVPYSRLAARLLDEDVLAATVAVGQGFGGTYEAVNVYTGLLAARAVAGADLALVAQGPGNVGTGTRYGFGGMALVEALHAAELLGGTPVLAARMSDADSRPRHQGLSHHTRTLLESLRVPVALPLPSGASVEGLPVTPETVDPAPVLGALEPYRNLLTTMGRSLDQDSLFFRAAAAAGLFAARAAARQSGKTCL